MDQGSGRERLPGLLPRQPLGGQLAQLVIDEREQSCGRVPVARLKCIQQLGDVIHQPQMIPGRERSHQ